MTVTLELDIPRSQQQGFALTRNEEACLLDMPGGCGKIFFGAWKVVLGLERQYFWHNLEFALKALLAYVAFRHGGLLFHGAGVLLNGGAYLFTGESGSGKSTVVALSPDKVALNDDLVVLRPYGAGWWAYGTPFWNAAATQRDGRHPKGR